jgi:hypothetical protein
MLSIALDESLADIQDWKARREGAGGREQFLPNSRRASRQLAANAQDDSTTHSWRYVLATVILVGTTTQTCTLAVLSYKILALTPKLGRSPERRGQSDGGAGPA